MDVRQTSPSSRALGRTRRRGGYTLLEAQVAFAVLGIGLAGLCPFVVIQLRQVRQLELRFQGNVVQTKPGTGTSQTMLQGNTYYIVPWTNVWAQKLAGSSQILTSPSNSCDPGYLPLPSPTPQSYPVNIIRLDAAPYSQDVTVAVDVSAP
jgi:type II secretory pathway pseudopilin PulG